MTTSRGSAASLPTRPSGAASTPRAPISREAS
jgi:hypothetical protein